MIMRTRVPILPVEWGPGSPFYLDTEAIGALGAALPGLVLYLAL